MVGIRYPPRQGKEVQQLFYLQLVEKVVKLVDL
jgi:hypothetical protein